MNVNDFITFIGNEEDLPYLKTSLLDVNMRLFNNKKNPTYRRIVQSCCTYLANVALKSLDGYKKPHGMSGANIGIPFNIIGIVRERGTSHEYCEIMINPHIKVRSKEKSVGMSNCGSIRLPEPIPVKRHDTIGISWYNIDGVRNSGAFRKQDGGFTIQHEIDHNQGILITDRAEIDNLQTT
jgi:peptide deformylase